MFLPSENSDKLKSGLDGLADPVGTFRQLTHGRAMLSCACFTTIALAALWWTGVLSDWLFEQRVQRVTHDTPFCNTTARDVALASGPKFYLPVKAQLSATCFVGASNEVLLRQCRLQHHLREFQDLESPPDNEPLLDALIASCPAPQDPNRDELWDQRSSKYESRMGENACQSARGMWRSSHSLGYKCVLAVLAHWLHFEPGQLVLDWGCGCGQKLTMLKQLYDVDGIGIDVTPGAISWAQEYSFGRFCQIDGRNMSWLPDETFDTVFSYAALYHLPTEDQCGVLDEMVRVTRPGGWVFVGWMGTDHPLPVEHWLGCPVASNTLPHKLRVIPEFQTFSSRMDVVSDFVYMANHGPGFDFEGQYSSYAILIQVNKAR